MNGFPTSRSQAAERLANGGYDLTQALIAGRLTLIADRVQFRFRWIASRLHTFVFLVDATGLDRAGLEAFVGESVKYSRRHRRGLPLGLQSGCAAVTIAFAEHPSQDAVVWASAPAQRRFATLSWPVLATADFDRAIRQPGRALVGALYAPHFREIAETYIQPVSGPAFRAG